MLDIDLATVAFQIVDFLLLAWLLNRFLFAPAIRRIRVRAMERARMERELAAEVEKAQRLREELEARLAKAEEEAATIITEAQDQAEARRAEILEEARAEALRILSEAQVDAVRLKQQAVDEFHDELLQAVLDVSALVIERVAPQELHDRMLKQLTDRIWELGRREMQRVETLRRALGERTPTVFARTARPLSPEQQGLLVRTFSALADRNVNLDIRVDPAMGLGVRVRIGDLVVDNTIAGKLESLRSSVADALKEKVADDDRAAVTTA